MRSEMSNRYLQLNVLNSTNRKCSQNVFMNYYSKEMEKNPQETHTPTHTHTRTHHTHCFTVPMFCVEVALDKDKVFLCLFTKYTLSKVYLEDKA